MGHWTNLLKDLDQKPPSTVPSDGRGDVWFSSTSANGDNTLFGQDGALLGLWTDPTHPPSYAECQQRARSGVDRAPLHLGAVLCVRTNVGRTAMLVVTKLSEPAQKGSLPTFDVTVWEPVTQ